MGSSCADSKGSLGAAACKAQGSAVEVRDMSEAHSVRQSARTVGAVDEHAAAASEVVRGELQRCRQALQQVVPRTLYFLYRQVQVARGRPGQLVHVAQVHGMGGRRTVCWQQRLPVLRARPRLPRHTANGSMGSRSSAASQDFT